jgi:hypothetical protein
MISYVNNSFEPSKAKADLGRGRMTLRVIPVVTSEDRSSRATLMLAYRRGVNLLPAWLSCRLPELAKAIRRYALSAAVIGLIVWGIAGIFFARRVHFLEQPQQAHRNGELIPTTSGPIVSYRLARDEQRVRSPAISDIPEIFLQPHSHAISLRLPFFQGTGGKTCSADVKALGEDQTLLTNNSLSVKRDISDSFVEIVVPTDLLKRNTYYTVYLHYSQFTNQYTFKVSAQ